MKNKPKVETRTFNRKVYIIKNAVKDEKDYQRAITLPMDVTRELGINQHDEVIITIRKKDEEKLY